MTSRTRGWARAIGTLLGWLAAGATALACPICFQAEPNGTTDGVRSAVVVLLGVTSVVLGGFAVFIVRFAGHELGPKTSGVFPEPPTPEKRPTFLAPPRES